MSWPTEDPGRRERINCDVDFAPVSFDVPALGPQELKQRYRDQDRGNEANHGRREQRYSECSGDDLRDLALPPKRLLRGRVIEWLVALVVHTHIAPCPPWPSVV